MPPPGTRAPRSALVVAEPVDEQGETDAEHPEVLGDAHALRGRAQVPSSRISGGRKYRPSRPAEKVVSAAPATTLGRTGRSSAVPSASSPAQTRRTNRCGGIERRNG